MLLCCSTPMVPGASLTEKAERLAEWGYDAIAVFQGYDEWNDSVHSELLGLHERTGVKPVEFVLMSSFYGRAMDDDETLRGQCRQMYRQSAEVCAEIGAVTEIEYQYGPQDPLPLFDPFQQLDEEQKDRFCEFYTELLDVVAGSEGRVLLEPLNRYESRYLNRAQDNVEILDRVEHPNAGLLPDTFHLSLEEADIPAVLRQYASYVRHVHLGDTNRLLPGHGHLDWAAIFAALRDIGYSGYVNLECSSENDPARTLPETAAKLRDLIGS